MALVGAGPTAVRVVYLLARGHPLGVFTLVGVALLPIEFAATVFVDETVFVFVHLAFGTLFAGHWLAARTAVTRTAVSRLDGPGRGSASRAEW